MANSFPIEKTAARSWIYNESPPGSPNISQKILYVADLYAAGKHASQQPQALPVFSAQELIDYYKPEVELELVLPGVDSSAKVIASVRPRGIEDLLNPLMVTRILSSQGDAGRALGDLVNVNQQVTASGAQKVVREIEERIFSKDESSVVNLSEIDQTSLMGRMVNGLIVLKQLEVGEGGDVSFLSILQAKRKAERFFGGLLVTDPKFKRFQSNWLSLDSLLSFSRGYEDVSIWVLSLGISELEEQAYASATGSSMFDDVYSNELGQFGGAAFTLILIGESFAERKNKDALIQFFADLGKASSVPVVCDPGFSLLGIESITELDGFENLTPRLSPKIKAILGSGADNFLFLAPSSLQSRCELANGAVAAYTGPSSMVFDESGGLQVVKSVIHTSSATLFYEFGRPHEKMTYENTISYWVSVELADQLSQFGLNTPFTDNPVSGYEFGAIRPLSVAGQFPEHLDPPDNSTKPDILALSKMLKVIHSLKTWVREEIGSSASPDQRLAQINTRLSGYVLDSSDPDPESVKARPFRLAHVRSVQSDQQSSLFRVDLKLHAQTHQKPLAFSTDISFDSMKDKQ